jgi:predicted DNA-binding transcriptional regulator YafY
MVNHVLNYSFETKMPITIIYQKDMEISQRQILVRNIEQDIVHAYCCSKKAIRNFKKDNILSAMISGTKKRVQRVS